jgi:iron complex outermembrane recepter protein
LFENVRRTRSERRKPMSIKLISLWIILICSTVAPGFAAEKQELDEVIVTGSRVETKIRETSSTVNVVGSRELEELKYRNPAEVLNRVPGTYTNSFAGEDALSSIRVPTSFINPYTLILVDGIPASSYGQGNASVWRELNSMDIERVEVVKGPASALYGSSAIGGVINVITRKPGEKPEARAWAEYGRWDRIRGGVSGSVRSGSFAGNINGYLISNEGWRENSTTRKQSVTANGEYVPDDRSLLNLRVDYTHFDNKVPGALDVGDFHYNPRQDYYTFTYTRMDKLTPVLTYTRSVGNSGELKLTFQSRIISDHENFSTYSIRYDTRTRTFSGTPSRMNGLDFDLQGLYKHEFKPLNSRIVAGVDYERSSQEIKNYLATVTRDDTTKKFISYSNPVLNGSFDTTANVLAPYAQFECSPLPKMRFVAGGRYDTVYYDVEDKFAGTMGGTRYFDKFTGKTGLTYDLTKNLNLYANCSQGFVAPSPGQLFTTSRGANPDLSPEKAENYEVGLRSSFWNKKLSFDLSYYDMRITDKIITQTISVSQILYRNVGETSHRGVEVQASLKPFDFLRASLSYTYARNTYESYADTNSRPPKYYDGNTLPRAPEHHLNARLAFLPLKGLEVELEMDTVSKQYADDANTMSYTRPTIFNLRTAYNMKEWSFWCHILNLTNQNYATYISESNVTANTMSLYPGDPVSFFVGAAYRWN